MSDDTIPVHPPQIEHFGLYAFHDMACPVYYDKGNKAVFNCNEEIFAPSWEAQDNGYLLVSVPPGWRRWLVRKLAIVL